ncbi:Oidioi.mRNA.OKI2018_I69.chr1.g1463.t1.cds [Oikopleura dioica]|uniref:Oidioi.mRNA.OKI2018_I69.chr1.g1463.t1.cds n=1 Tax=Oikopleura dioica TaxID=34765 RepID=A0ABN7SX78_OIKDI|nr:Oidioi.mRNA.OKI2018_I69.chr1.g1463.t1.cds [Oikopleura dioica]
MNPVEAEARENCWPVQAEISGYRTDLWPTRYFVRATPVEGGLRIDEKLPAWYNRLEEGVEFTAFVSDQTFNLNNPEEKAYFESLEKKFKRKTGVIWLTDCLDRKKAGYEPEGKTKGLFVARAFTACPTI